MAYKKLAIALGMIFTASSVSASQPQPTPQEGAPAAPPDARYCLKVDPLPGSRIETIMCETRDEWAQLEVDLDQEWATEGVRVIPPSAPNS
jgi:hypothetical protein